MLDSSTGGLDASLYFRLLTLSGLDILMNIPYSIYGFTTWFPVYPWVGWAVIHFDFSRIDRFPPALWQGDHKIRLRLEGERWIIVVYAFIFCCSFGLTDEARRRYALALRFVAKKVGYKTGSSGSGPSKYVAALHLSRKISHTEFHFYLLTDL
jgi:pheromone a factor receptor